MNKNSSQKVHLLTKADSIGINGYGRRVNMAYKCRICGSNDVDNQGDICELCAIGQDPYATSMSSTSSTKKHHILNNNDEETQDTGYSPRRGSNRKVLINGGSDLSNRDPYGNDMTTDNSSPTVQVYHAGQVPQQVTSSTTSVKAQSVPSTSNNQPISTGITKNISIDNQKKSILAKWFRALFTGIPFTLDDEITMFQVFPDYSGTSLNSLGNACDQVIVYGKLNHGAISENNDVEVYGRRDSNNNIIAKTIRNKASGTTVSPMRTLGVGAVWAITAILLCLIFGVISALGPVGIVWTIVIILCFTNLPLVVKIIGVIFGALFSLLKKLF